MYKYFQTFIKKYRLFTVENRLLCAVSGGVDSMVMIHLLQRYGIFFSIAHCNFQLRGKESLEDESFVKEFSKKNNITCYKRCFNTYVYAKKEALSIQLAARRLRYGWFKFLLKKYNYDFILTAHHANDQVETVLYHLIKGTGISGVRGILAKRATLVRPLLFASKEMIFLYAKKHNIAYRTDSSSSSIKYSRNLIRHKVVPILKKINPQLERTAVCSLRKLAATEQIFLEYITEFKKRVWTEKGKLIFIQKKPISQYHYPDVLLYELLKPLGFFFHQVENICGIIPAQTGKHILSSKNYICYVERDKYVVYRIASIQDDEEIYLPKEESTFKLGNLTIDHKKHAIENYMIQSNKFIGALDFDCLSYPLKLRKWKKGDTFIPLGMKKNKKISDFLRDEKIPFYLKKDSLVLLSKEKIIWVVGKRISEEFKITRNTTTVSEFSFSSS